MHASDDKADLQQAPARSTRIAWYVLGGFVAVGLVVVWLVDPAKNDLPLCMFHAMTGMHCPGCGATRATHALLHGQFLEALHDNVLWVTLLPLGVLLAFGEVWRHHTGRPLKFDLLRKNWFYIAIGVLMLTFFLVRNLPGWPWELLCPLP